MAYCRWAGTSLPSEAQWEYAARGAGAKNDDGTLKPGPAFPWGNNWDRKLCNNSSFHAGVDLLSAKKWTEWYESDQAANHPLTSKVGSFRKSRSPFGIDDMAGNAWEWCVDWYDPKKKQNRVGRGGSWHFGMPLLLSSSTRGDRVPEIGNSTHCFRCVLTNLYGR